MFLQRARKLLERKQMSCPRRAKERAKSVDLIEEKRLRTMEEIERAEREFGTAWNGRCRMELCGEMAYCARRLCLRPPLTYSYSNMPRFRGSPLPIAARLGLLLVPQRLLNWGSGAILPADL